MVLCDGYIQQIGIPTELYLEPENVFVAAFLGQLTTAVNGAELIGFNVLNAGSAEHPFTSTVSANVRPQLHGDVKLMCRPDNVRVHVNQPTPDVPNALMGTIKHTSFVAGRWRTLIQVPGQPEPILTYPMFSPQIEQSVWLGLPPHDCRVLPV